MLRVIPNSIPNGIPLGIPLPESRVGSRSGESRSSSSRSNNLLLAFPSDLTHQIQKRRLGDVALDLGATR